MGRVVHFEIHVDDMERAKKFYENVLGWKIQLWDGPIEYMLVSTGEQGTPGIDGALMPREGTLQVVNTVDVADLDAAVAAVEANGGSIQMPKGPVPGIGYLAYAKDSEGNMFGMMQRDESAR